MAQFLAEIKRLANLALDWIFWFILWGWNKTAGQISVALNQDFRSLPDWKAVLYAGLVLLLAYVLYLSIPTILAGILRIFSAIWGFVETIVTVLIGLVWYLAAIYGTALVINNFRWGALVGKMPWQ